MQQTYHCAVACGHYARILAPHYQTIAVLEALWLRAVDPFAHEAVVFVAAEHLRGIVPSDGRLRQILQELREIGALDRKRPSGGGYRLHKPTIDQLDADARAELDHARKLEAQAQELTERASRIVRTQSTAPVDATSPAREDDGSAGAKRRAALEAAGKQLSDVRDGLEAMMLIPRDKRGQMRFAGKGSMPVQLAADFVAQHGWSKFVAVCRAVAQDKSPDKPRDLKWLFADRNADYLARFTETT